MDKNSLGPFSTKVFNVFTMVSAEKFYCILVGHVVFPPFFSFLTIQYKKYFYLKVP